MAGSPGFPPPFTPFTPDRDAPQMRAEDLARYPHAFEWWYFDLASDDGTDLVFILSRQNAVFATRKASIYLEYKDPARHFKHIVNHPQAALRVTDAQGVRELALGRTSVRIVGDDAATLRYEVTIDLPWLHAQLTMTPEHRGFLPTPSGTYFTHRRDPALYTAVSFSAPLMRIVGTLTIDGRPRPVQGRGYHDHPWGTQQLFETHRAWNWARTVTRAAGVMFAKVTPAADFEGALTFCYSAALGQFEPSITDALTVDGSDWRRDGLFGIRYPHALAVATPTQRWSAASTGSLLDTPIYDRCACTWTPAGGPAGQGWIEYFSLPPWARSLAFLGARLQTFFLRPFPWWGR